MIPVVTTMLALPSTVGLEEAKDVLSRLQQAVAADPADPWIVDAAALQSFDSSALAVLLECRRLAQASNRSMVLRDPPPRLKQLARLYGVATLLGLDAPATAGQPA